MAKYEITAPDGAVYEVEAPDDAKEADVLAYAQSQFNQPEQKSQKPSMSDELLRQAGLTGRYITEAGAGLADIVGSPIRGLANLALPESQQIPSLTDVVERRLTLPQPETPTERVVGDVSRAMAATGMTMGLAGAASPLSQAGQSIKTALTANAPTQAAAAIGGGGSSGLAREMGGGVGSQITAGLAGGLAGGLAVKPTQIGKSVKELQNAPRDKVLKEAQKQGYVALPSDVGAGKFTRALQTVSGKFKAEELASAKNQQVTNSLVRKYLNLTDDAPLDTDTLTSLRQNAAEPYRQAAQLPASQVATTTTKSLGTGKSTTKPILKSGAELVDEINAARDDARSLWKSISMGTEKPNQIRKAALEADARVNALENQLESIVKKNNQPQLLNELQNARKEIAKIYTVEKATNPVTGDVDARAIARELKKKAPITDELQLVGKFAQAFPKVTKLVNEKPNAFSIYDVIGTSYGIGAANPLIYALPAARVASRYGLMSKPVQQGLVTPQYERLTTPFAPYQGLLSNSANQPNTLMLDPITVTPEDIEQ
jgi:ribosomal protein L29